MIIATNNTRITHVVVTLLYVHSMRAWNWLFLLFFVPELQCFWCVYICVCVCVCVCDTEERAESVAAGAKTVGAVATIWRNESSSPSIRACTS